MVCVVSEDVVKKELSEYSVYTEGYKLEGENKFFVLGQADKNIGLYKIEEY